MDAVPEVMVQEWQAVYRDYIAAAQTRNPTPEERRNIALLSAAVATAWRQMASTPNLEWWTNAALTAAAEAFEQQAQEWGASRRTLTHATNQERGRRRGRQNESWLRLQPSAT